MVSHTPAARPTGKGLHRLPEQARPGWAAGLDASRAAAHEDRFTLAYARALGTINGNRGGRAGHALLAPGGARSDQLELGAHLDAARDRAEECVEPVHGFGLLAPVVRDGGPVVNG
jgi:hypothetical protein